MKMKQESRARPRYGSRMPPSRGGPTLFGKFLCAIGKVLGAVCPEKVTEETLLMSYNTMDVNYMSSILLDKLEEMNCTGEIYLPDAACKTYTKSSVMDHYALVETSGIDYIAEVHDCDDFAALLFADFAGLVWTNTHALNWFVDENETLWFVEPQTGQLAQTLEGWQGNDIRFFVGR